MSLCSRRLGFKISRPKQATHEILIWTSIASPTVQRTYFLGALAKTTPYSATTFHPEPFRMLYDRAFDQQKRS